MPFLMKIPRNLSVSFQFLECMLLYKGQFFVLILPLEGRLAIPFVATGSKAMLPVWYMQIYAKAIHRPVDNPPSFVLLS